MEPIEAAFQQLWPEVEVLSLLDESLYADVGADGVMAPSVPDRIATLVRHAAASGAEAIVFTGSTFGPAVDTARGLIDIPVLKADEAMALEAAARGGNVLLACTAARALPILIRNLEQAAASIGTQLDISTLVIPEAKRALVDGDPELHDSLILEAIARQPAPDSLLLGQMSMGRVARRLPPDHARVALTSPEATVRHLRSLFASAD